MHPRYPNVFKPIRIGPVEIANRFYASPHVQPMTTAEGAPTQDLIAYMVERFRGGIGLVNLSMTLPHRCNLVQPSPAHDPNKPALKALSDTIHDEGGRIFAELYYWWGRPGQWQTLSPPSVSMGPSQMQFHHLGRGMTTREMTVAEIDAMVAVYGKATANLRETGYDGIMLHAAHGAQIEHFMSPYFNRRTDEYGGSFENRMRFPMRVLREIRENAGSHMAVGIRLNCDELLKGGYSTDEAYRIAEWLRAERLVDFFDLDIAIEPNQFQLGMAPVFVTPHQYKPYVRAVREAAGDLPVLSVLGRLTSIDDAEAALAEGLCDMVGAARALIAEPNLVNLARDGKEDRTHTCIACNWCMSSLVEGAQSCTINPVAWRERFWGEGTIQPAPKRCKVVVVGGGPGGMEAARVAALRGHDVVLMEARAELGGALALWSMIPGRETYAKSIEWWRREIADLPIDVRLGVSATLESILAEAPDAVILATGASYCAGGNSHFCDQPIAGADSAMVCTPDAILTGAAEARGKVVIQDGEGTHAGVGLAEWLAARGHAVELLTPYFSPVSTRVDAQFETGFIMKRLRDAGVRVSASTYLREIGEGQVTAYDVYSEEDRVIGDVGTVVLSTGRVANNALEKALEGKVAQLFAIGDAAAVRPWAAASFEGHKFARLIGEPGAPATIGEVYFADNDPELAPRLVPVP